MTTNERREAVVEWLKTAKAGDEVCVTNIYDATRLMSGLFNTVVPKGLQNEMTDDICTITTIRAILPDGAIVVGDKIFKADGTLEENTPMSGNPSIHPVTDELRRLTWRHRFCKTVKNIEWSKISDDGISDMIDIINREIIKKEEENKEEERQEKERVAKEQLSKDAKLESGLTISNASNASSSSLIDNVSPVISRHNNRCPDCPNRKENKEVAEDGDKC